MVKTIGLFTLVMSLSGCVTPYVSNQRWVNYSKSQSEVNADLYDCQYKAKMLAQASTSQYDNQGMAGAVFGGYQAGTIIAQETNNCMRSKGYNLQ